MPPFNDIASGKPEYVRILTDVFARQLAAQTQRQLPAIVEQDEDAPCPGVNALTIAVEEFGTLFTS